MSNESVYPTLVKARDIEPKSNKQQFVIVTKEASSPVSMNEHIRMGFVSQSVSTKYVVIGIQTDWWLN